MARINGLGLLLAVGLAALLPLAAAHGRRAATVKVLASSTPLLTKSTPMSPPQYGGRPLHKPHACSCAHPTPLPVGPAFDWLRQQDAHITSEEDAGSAMQGKQQQHKEEEARVERSGHRRHDDDGDEEAEDRLAREDACHECNELPRAHRGGKCGATLGICKAGLCCGQDGICSDHPESCDGTCQCKYSGPGSDCKGSLPFALPYRLPLASSGGVCGDYIAACPLHECCSQFGFCVSDSTQYCRAPSCQPLASPGSATCVDSAHVAEAAVMGGGGAARPAIDTASPNYHYKRGKVRTFHWVVTWKNLTLDGFERPVIVINGEPFPNLFVDVGDRVIVHVTNLLNEPLSVHWHGMLQRRTNIMDGVVPVTQRPVYPGERYIYNFIADTPGTYWWHSHFNTQYVDGLWGGLVIRDPTADLGAALTKTTLVEAVVTVNEWYHEGANILQQYYLSPASGGNEPVPYDALMNGFGQGYCILNGLNNTCGYTRIKGVAAACASGPRMLLRIINAGAFARFNVSVDHHRMFVVGEDGVQVDPVEVGSLQINNGQRYGVIVCQDTTVAPLSEEPVWIRAVMDDEDFAYPANYSTVLGVLYFRDEDVDTLPTSQPINSLPALNPSEAGPGVVNPYFLRVAGGITPPGPATTFLEYAIDFYNEPPDDPNATQYAHFSNISLNMVPDAPSLLERLTNNPEHLPPPVNPPVPPGGLGWHVVEIQRGAIVDIIINNRDTGEHPIHLHGHWFWVLDAGLPGEGDFPGNPARRAAARGPLEPGHLARDTVTVNLESFLVLRYFAVNPGSWIMHCHIDWHLAGGLGLIFKEAFPPYPHVQHSWDTAAQADAAQDAHEL